MPDAGMLQEFLAGGQVDAAVFALRPDYRAMLLAADGLVYAAVQFVCRPTVVDDPQGKAEILTAQLADFQPEGGHAAVAAGTAPYGRMLPGIRGVRLTVPQVDAKFKYDDANPVQHRQRVTGYLEQRGHGLDAGAATQQRRPGRDR